MAIINKINTRSMLVKRGILDTSAANCPICLVEEEMVDHLFLHCYKHWLIWSKIINWWGLAWCCPGNLANLFSQWDSLVYGKFQKKAWVMLFFSVAWSIWLLRNDVIFKQKIPDYDTLFFLIVTRLCLWLKAIEPDFPYSSSDLLRSAEGLIRWTNSQTLRTGVMWSPPMTNRFKWNVDGSSIRKPGPSGIGGVLRNHHGILLGIFSLSVGILDSNIAELRAVIKAIELSASNCFLHHKHIIIESDSANVISWMNKLFSSAKRLASCFDSITYTHSYRESNHMADHLAKQGVHRISDFVAWL
jgi:ribonuclease HI